LKQVYLWESAFSDEGITQLKDDIPEVDWIKDVSLTPPPKKEFNFDNDDLKGHTNFANTATASSKGKKDGNAIGPEGAIDGDIDTFWDETDDQDDYRLTVTLKEKQDVSAIAILAGVKQNTHHESKYNTVTTFERVVIISLFNKEQNKKQ